MSVLDIVIRHYHVRQQGSDAFIVVVRDRDIGDSGGLLTLGDFLGVTTECI